VSIVVAVSAVRQSGGWGRNALLALELGALLGFWLACLSCLLRRSGPALVLVWTTVLSGLIVTVLISAVTDGHRGDGEGPCSYRACSPAMNPPSPALRAPSPIGWERVWGEGRFTGSIGWGFIPNRGA